MVGVFGEGPERLSVEPHDIGLEAPKVGLA